MKPRIVLGEYLTEGSRQVTFNVAIGNNPPQRGHGFAACKEYIEDFIECLQMVDWIGIDCKGRLFYAEVNDEEVFVYWLADSWEKELMFHFPVEDIDCLIRSVKSAYKMLIKSNEYYCKDNVFYHV